MKEFATDKIRNLCLAGQRGCGKTSIADTIAFITGVNSRIGRVDDGSSLFDYTDAEMNRKTTVALKLLACTFGDIKINLVDCPGHVDFIGELLSSATVCDSVGIVLDAGSGVEIGTKLHWRGISPLGGARFFFVNKMEKENVKWKTALDSLKETIGKQAVAVQIPIGEAEKFAGLVDLLHMKAYTFDKDGKRTETAIPADLKAEADAQREALIEVAAESDDALIEKFFSEGTLSESDTLRGLRKGIADGTLYPVLFGSAARQIGIRMLLEFVQEYLPSPDQMPSRKAIKTNTNTEVEIPCNSGGKAVLHVFKTLSEGHLGDMSLFRCLSGKVVAGSELVNQQTSATERVSHCYSIQGKNRIDVDGVQAGDIGVLVKLKNTRTGHTLSDKDFGVTLPAIKYPNPVMDVAMRPKAKGDEEKIATGLHKLQDEDPTFKVIADPALHQTVLWAQGPSHIEVLTEKLSKRYGVEIELSKPRIPYRETVRGKTEKQYRHKKQSGGRGQYGDVHLRIEPNGRGNGFEFVDAITGGVIPGKFVPAVQKGVEESMQHGGLAGAPVVDVKVTLFFGSYHDVDSSEMAFKIAGSMAFREGFLECRPVILEPVFNLEVSVPNEFTGDVMGDLSSRRGKVSGMEPDGTGQKVKALVPQSELYQYSVDLRSMTQGQGVYAAGFSHYEEVPHETAQKIIAEAQAEKAAESGS